MGEIMNKDSVILASFACLGKTYFAKKYPSIAIDIDSLPYRMIEYSPSDNLERQKGSPNLVTTNSAFPANYIDEVLRCIGKYRFIFVTLSPAILQELEGLGLSYSILYPKFSRKERIMKDAEKRGNNYTFVKMLEGILSTPEERNSIVKNRKYDDFIVLEDDEYIEDYIKRKYTYAR